MVAEKNIGLHPIIYRPFRRVLIANRGEVACRIIRAARAEGLETVAVFSEQDRNSLHVSMADHAICIGAAEAASSYLNIETLCAAILQTQADAVHPGYGFLAENADFAQAVIATGAVWVGPRPESIQAMGNKARAKERMLAAGVPCIPGYEGLDQDDEHLSLQAARIGFPIMVKAAAGGGGRGMRCVHDADQLPDALIRARHEALHAFGSQELILERAITAARHIEIQIVGDVFGSVIHLGERDCSVQRRHQKLIEESPSPAVDAALRARMGAMAVQAAQAIAYVGVGTVECLLTPDGTFYFMEMNTRLQVEHAVTEAIYGVDLVAMQFQLAAGEPLRLKQQQVGFTGHAIEVRLTAEDVGAGFLPQSGTVYRWQSPAQLEGIRVDHCLSNGTVVSPYYDSMIAKIIAVGENRTQAISRLLNALRQTVVLGIPTNQPFLAACLHHPVFQAGQVTTDFVEKYRATVGMQACAPSDQTIMWAAITVCGLVEKFFKAASGDQQNPPARRLASVVTKLRLHTLDVTSPGAPSQSWVVSLQARSDGFLQAYLGDEGTTHWTVLTCSPRDMHFILDDGVIHIFIAGRAWRFRIEDPSALKHTDIHSFSSSGVLRAPLSARAAQVNVVAGASVLAGQVLVVLEAMKMEHMVVAPFAGIVSELCVETGAQVRSGTHLFTVKASL